MRAGEPPSVALLSVEPWDATWRRNQHLASRLQDEELVSALTFVEPPSGGWAPRPRSRREGRIVVTTPPLVVPRRLGGHVPLGRWLSRATRHADVLWVNDPVAGAAAVRLTPERRVLYDVTDDWRSMDQTQRDRRRLVAAEDVLARLAATVVCSDELARRWRERYAVTATVVPNGVDTTALDIAPQITPPGRGPHAVYVGTLHRNRIDLALTADLARSFPGSLHLVGPIGLTADERRGLAAAGALLHGPIAASAVGSWLHAADVLVCPHLVDDFTLSLDAIKAHEYLSTDRPVVSTASSGFQQLAEAGLSVVDRSGFVAAVTKAVGSGPFGRPRPADWSTRAGQFAAVLRSTASERA